MIDGEFMTSSSTVNCVCDDLLIEPIGMPADAVMQGVDGSVFCACKGELFKRGPQENSFFQISRVEKGESPSAIFMAFDHAQNIYYVPRGKGEIKISRDYGKSFTTCFEAGASGHFRGFAVDNQGGIFIGSYSRTGPAHVFHSADEGRTWASVLALECCHVHDVAFNPYNNFLYAIAGEYQKGSYYSDAYRIFPSRDNGKTWKVIAEPQKRDMWGWGRPLYLGIGFLGNMVVLSTDHAEGGNGIDVFEDSGEDRLHMPKRVYDNPPETHVEKNAPGFCWRIVAWNASLYAICANPHGKSLLLRSHDAVNWEKCAEFGKNVGRQPEFSPWSDKMYFSGQDTGYCLRLVSCPVKSLPKSELTPEFWSSNLAAFDRRLKTFFCGGYYYVSLSNPERFNKIFELFEKEGIAKDALIADNGCGVGSFLLVGQSLGFTNIVGVEANPRWLYGLRHLYEKVWPCQAPQLCLAPRGSYNLPGLQRPFDAVVILGVFTGNGNNVPFDEAMSLSFCRLGNNGFICFNIDPGTYGETSPEVFLRTLAQIGFISIKCVFFRNKTFLLTARKPG